MALGQGEQVGYSNLVDAWLGIQIDKGARFTDWARRPLNDRQIDYAIGDVTHLAALFPKMLAKLMKTGRGAWLDGVVARAEPFDLLDTRVPVVRAADLVLLKLHAGGSQDLWDVAQLLASDDGTLADEVASRLAEVPRGAAILWRRLRDPRDRGQA